MKRRTLPTLFLSLLSSQSLTGQITATGSRDYALAYSSVSLFTGGGALYRNPAALARLRQNEVMLSTARFRDLTSLTWSNFFPGTGTAAVGVGPDGNASLFSAGFGMLHSSRITSGAAISVRERMRAGWRILAGASVHILGDERFSGVDAGTSVGFGKASPSWSFGAGWWVLKEGFRIQYGLRSSIPNGGSLGLEMFFTGNSSFQLGFQGFKKLNAGFGLRLERVDVHLATGSQGVSLSLSMNVGESPEEVHGRLTSEGYESLGEKRYQQAAVLFRRATLYDEYDFESARLSLDALARLDSAMIRLEAKAEEDRQKKDFPGAMRAYAEMLRLRPERTDFAAELDEVEMRLVEYVGVLVQEGDSLRRRRETQKARAKYEEALELDPSNAAASEGIDELENLSREGTRSMLARGRSMIQRGQLDDAEKEFRRLLTLEPRNAGARAGLASIEKARLEKVFDGGIAAFDEGRYFDALSVFLGVLDSNADHRGAQEYVEKARKHLEPQVDELFRTGLQNYVNEDYEAAIDYWDRILLINPEHIATREYKRRAEEKLEALRKLK